MKRPGATRLTSSRCAKRVRASSICACDHGVTKNASRPIAITIGHAKRSTGPTHASRLCPAANHTTISESRYARDSVISTATNSVSVRMTGSHVSAVSATSCSTAWLSTRPPAAWPRMRTRPTEKRIENSTVNTALAVLVSSATMERRKIIRRRARCRGKPAGRGRPRYILRGGSRSRARTPGATDESGPHAAHSLNASPMGRKHASRDFSEGNPRWNLAQRSVAPRP